MYSLYLFTVLGVLIGFIIGDRAPHRQRNDRFGKTGHRISGVFYGLLFGGLVGFLVAIGMPQFVPYHNVASRNIPLSALHSSDGFSGAFVWGSGTIASQQYYNFIYRNDDGSLSPGQLPADSAVHIMEDPSLHEQGYWHTITNEPDRSSPLAAWALFNREPDTVIEQDFRVPAGTVVQSFRIN